MNFIDILREATRGSLHSLLQIALIVIPLMVVLQIAEDLNLLVLISKVLGPIVRPLGLRKEGALPLMVGLFFGITYGAGVIIPASEDGTLTQREILLITIFLSICHALVEDTMLFAVLGANGLILVSARLFLGALITIMANKVLSHGVVLSELRDSSHGAE